MDQAITARAESACEEIVPDTPASRAGQPLADGAETAFVVKEVDVAAINFELGHIWPNVS